MFKSIAILALSSIALLLSVTGCGSDDSAEAEQIDKATFVKRADAICKKASGKLAAEFAATSSRATATLNPGRAKDRMRIQVILVQDVLIPGLEAELKQLRALGIPPEGKSDVEAFLRQVHDIVEAAEADPEAFARTTSPYEDAELAGRKYGISACPVSPVSPS